MVLYFELKQSCGETNDLQLSRTPNEIINDRAHAGAFCPGGATVITTTSSTCVYRRMFARAQSIKDTEQRIVVDGEVGHSTYLLVFHDISMYFSCCTFNHPQVKLEHMDCPGSRYKFRVKISRLYSKRLDMVIPPGIRTSLINQGFIHGAIQPPQQRGGEQPQQCAA